MADQKNLQSIQRIDNSACEVILHCTQAALYEFNQSLNKWKDTNTTGSLFVYRRQDFPFYALMIANRQSLEDYVEPIVEGLNFKYDPPYILIHREDGMIRGLWVYGEDECKRIFNKIDEAHKFLVNGGGNKLERDQQKKDKENVTTRLNKERQNVIEKNNTENVAAIKNKEKENIMPKKNNAKELTTTNNKGKENEGTNNVKKAITTGGNNIGQENVATTSNNKLATTPEEASSSSSSGNATFVQQIKTLQNIVLTMTKRIDPFACELVVYFQQSTLYQFSIDQNRWEKAGTAGPLIVFKRMDFPNYSMIIIDQKMKSDFIQPIDEKLKIEHRAPYLFLSGRSDDQICGIWLPSTDDCTRLHKIIMDLMKEEFGKMKNAVIIDN